MAQRGERCCFPVFCRDPGLGVERDADNCEIPSSLLAVFRSLLFAEDASGGVCKDLLKTLVWREKDRSADDLSTSDLLDADMFCVGFFLTSIDCIEGV